MESETIIYGLAKDATKRWEEQILSAPGRLLTPEEVEKVKAAAAVDGFHSFRVNTWYGTPPDFTNVLNF